MLKKKFHIRGMHCRSCELLTEEELMKIPGVLKVKTHFHSGLAELFYEGHEPQEREITQAVQKAGYEIGRGEQPWIKQDIQAWVEALFGFGIIMVAYLFLKSLGVFDISLGSSEKLSSLPFVLLLGLTAGFSTCMAIIGGMVLAVSARFSEMHPEASPWQKFTPHIYFNVGRVGGFAILGAVLGAVGSTFQLSSVSVGIMTLVVGGIMFLLGVQLLELFPRLSAWKFTLPKSVARSLGIQAHAQKEYSHRRAMLLGAATFFLPCGFTQLTQLFVVTQGSPLVGALTMGTFALGTAPGLLGIGGLSAAAQGGVRRLFFKTAGVLVIILGVWNVNNGSALVQLGFSRDASETSGTTAINPNGEVQVVRITQKGNGYFPNQITVKKGQPVRLIVDSQESYSCASSLLIPKLGINKSLQPGENVFEFTPTTLGKIPFSCSMGMYRGVINVND